MKGCLHIVRGMKKKLTLPVPSIKIKADGTIWYQGMPLLGIEDAQVKAKAVAAVKAKRYADIPDDAYTRMGDNPNGLWAGDDAAWSKHPANLRDDARAQAKAEQQAKIVRIYLSSRGWGDFSPVEWIGDITRPDADILAECRQLLINGYDVDNTNQSHTEILALITAARSKWSTPKQPFKTPTHGPGYCYSCETYCYGDCGHYNPDPQIKYRRDLREAQREQNYGVED